MERSNPATLQRLCLSLPAGYHASTNESGVDLTFSGDVTATYVLFGKPGMLARTVCARLDFPAPCGYGRNVPLQSSPSTDDAGGRLGPLPFPAADGQDGPSVIAENTAG